MRWLLLATVAILVFALVFPTGVRQQPPADSAPESAIPESLHRTPDIIALGDLHGDLLHAVASLHAAGVLDDDGHWKLGTGTLVQVGDILDRGDDGRYLLDLLHQLTTEATAAGGRVVQLLGNHELMNLASDLRYVTQGDFDLFGGRKRRAEALSSKGDYGRRLRGFSLVAGVNDTVFVHAGLTAEWAKKGLRDLNRLGAKAIEAQAWGFSRARGHPFSSHSYFSALDCNAEVLADSGPTWTRDLVRSAKWGSCEPVQRALDALGKAEGRPFRRMVVGHTPVVDGRVQFFCGGLLVDIDIALSRGMGRGHVGALAIYHNADGTSEAYQMPPKGKYRKKVALAIAGSLSNTLRAQYMEDGRYPPV